MERILEFSGNHPFLVTALVFMIFLVVFHELRRRGQGATSVAPGDAVRLINRGAVVVDVREPSAWAAGHIVNSRNHAAAALKDNPELLAKQRKKALLLVCDTGMASNRAAGDLRKQGFEQVLSLRGGLNAWRTENLPVVKDEGRGKPGNSGKRADKGAAA
jgi:rhodanese-related sulfurtransferase